MIDRLGRSRSGVATQPPAWQHGWRLFFVRSGPRSRTTAQPTAKSQAPTADRRPPTADRRPPTANRQPPTANRRSPITDHRPPTTDQPTNRGPIGRMRAAPLCNSDRCAKFTASAGCTVSLCPTGAARMSPNRHFQPDIRPEMPDRSCNISLFTARCQNSQPRQRCRA